MTAATDPLSELLAPVRAERRKRELRIKELEAELATERADLQRYLKVIRVLDPSEPAPGRKLKAVADYAVSKEMLSRTIAYLESDRARYENGDGFTGSSLARDWKAAQGSKAPSDATVLKAIGVLHQQGQLRLLRRGTGGSKIYVLS